jgi:hypothetical protein
MLGVEIIFFWWYSNPTPPSVAFYYTRPIYTHKNCPNFVVTNEFSGTFNSLCWNFKNSKILYRSEELKFN